MSYPLVLGRRRTVPMFVFKRARLRCSFSLDERAQVALDAIVARTGAHGTATMQRLLDGKPRTSKTARQVLVAEYRRLFGRLPPGLTIDAPGRWTPPVKRAYQNDYSLAYREVRQLARPNEDPDAVRERARRAGQIAGRRAARHAASKERPPS